MGCDPERSHLTSILYAYHVMPPFYFHQIFLLKTELKLYHGRIYKNVQNTGICNKKAWK